MYNKSLPKQKSTVYVPGVRIPEKEPTLIRAVVSKIWWDKENSTKVTRLVVIDDLFGKYKKGAVVHIDFPWQIQYTLEDAIKVMIMAIFDSKYPGGNAFVRDIAPWE